MGVTHGKKHRLYPRLNGSLLNAELANGNAFLDFYQ